MMQHSMTYSSLFAAHINNLSEHGTEMRGCCPFHEDTTPSWTGNRLTGLWRCFGCGAQGNASQFAKRLGEEAAVNNEHQHRQIVATYDYRDERNTLLFQAVRFAPKGFAQRKPDGNGGWEWTLTGVKRVLYRLSEILTAETVYIVEGEKDADRLWSLGIPSTTNPQGAGKWREEYNASLVGKRIVIFPDNDEPGKQHARQIARSLLPVAALPQKSKVATTDCSVRESKPDILCGTPTYEAKPPVAKAVKIVRLPDLPPKGDVSDWLDAGHTKEELAEIVKATAALKAEDFLSTPSNEANTNPWTLAKSAPDLLAEEEKEFAGLAKDILAPGAVTLIAAPRGLGKTQTSHALAVALATGGRFRDEQVKAVRVLLLDRDNPDSLVKKRLRSWGASQAHDLHVLTRQNAPDLKNKEAWTAFPVEDYDVLIIDSIGSSTEGVTEKEGKQTTEILATILDLARKGLAILLLTNCTKDALSVKGRGEWSDRADIIYECRDATNFTHIRQKGVVARVTRSGRSGVGRPRSET